MTTLFLFLLYISLAMSDPYPPVVAASKIVVFDQSKSQCTPDQIIAVEALQGLVSRSSSTQIFRLDASKPDYQIWLQYIADHQLAEIDYTYQTDIEGLFKNFSEYAKSYILYNYTTDLNNTNLDVAFSTATVLGAIPSSTEFAKTLDSLGLNLIFNVTDNLDWTWFFKTHSNQIYKRGISFQSSQKATFLLDYATFGQMVTIFTNKVPSKISDQIFSLMEPNSFLIGWGTDEFKLVSTSSAWSTFVHAADWAMNLATLSNFPTNKTVQKYKEPKMETKQNVHTVCFLMTDGDNIQWLLDGFSSANWYGSPSRGKVPLGWTVSPALGRLSGPTLSSIYDNATEADYFVSAPSGIGYIYPDYYNSLQDYAKLTASFMGNSDLNIINVLAASNKTSTVAPFLQQENIDAVFYYLFENYSGMNGSINFINGKPVIGGRYNLWEGFETPQSLAAKLNKASTDITSSKGYSLIPVHVWSRTVEDVVLCQSLLNSAVVQVVKPNEFVQLIQQNVVQKVKESKCNLV